MGEWTNPPISRRTMLRALALGAAATPLLSACGAAMGGAQANTGAAANEVTGGFSWKKAQGTTLSVLLCKHPYTESVLPALPEFTALTGIEVRPVVVPEANYFDKLTIELLGAQGTYDVFMTGAYQVWQYAPPGWVEDLGPWVANASATSPDYDYEDILPNLRKSLQWDFGATSPLGTGGQWAIPWGWESNIVCYNAERFARYGLAPPGNLDELHEVALAYQEKARADGVAQAYGLAVRGTRNWGTMHPGFITQYTREGAKDFEVRGGKLVPAMDSPRSVDFHRRWLAVVREAGPADWSSYDYPQCAADLGTGAAGMMYDATSATYPQNKAGASPMAGRLAWSPGPKGTDGSLATNMWEWSLAVNAASAKKLAAWLFLQWATGKQYLTSAVLNHNHVDPVRASIVRDPRYRDKMAPNNGYLDSIEAVTPSEKVQFTPYKNFFEMATSWAAALQEIYLGADPGTRLVTLASDISAEVGR